MKNQMLLAAIALMTITFCFAQSKKENERRSFFSIRENSNAHAAALIGLPQKTISYQWRDYLNNWENYPDTMYTTYDISGKILNVISIYVDSLYTDQNKSVYTYNGQGLLSEELYYFWNSGLNQWDTSEKQIYTYDSFGNQTLSEYYFYLGGNFIIMFGNKNIYTLNGNNQITENIYQRWVDYLSAYRNTDKEIYTLDGQGKITEALFMEWDTVSNTFVNSGKAINVVWYQWNGTPDNSEIQSVLFQKWDGSTYVDDTKYNFTYDANGNATEEKFEMWDGSQWQIDSWLKYILTYNGTDLTERIEQYWDIPSSSFINERRTVYSDFIYVSGIAEDVKGRELVSIYPNPLNENAELRIQNVEFGMKNIELRIYDVLGQTVHQQTLNSKLETINLQLPNGIYFYQVKTCPTTGGKGKEKISNGKLIVQ